MTYVVAPEINNELILIEEYVLEDSDTAEVRTTDAYEGYRIGEFVMDFFSSDYAALEKRLRMIANAIMKKYEVQKPDSDEEYNYQPLSSYYRRIQDECSSMFYERTKPYISRKHPQIKGFLIEYFSFHYFYYDCYAGRLREYIEKCTLSPKWADYRRFILACESGFFPYVHARDSYKGIGRISNPSSLNVFTELKEMENLIGNKGKHELWHVYEECDVWQFISASLMEIFKKGYTIKKCEHCKRYFIPYQRRDTLYCDRASPMKPSRTCREYAASQKNYQKQIDEEYKKLERRIKNALRNRIKRNPYATKYQSDYKNTLDGMSEWRHKLDRVSMDDAKRSEVANEYVQWMIQLNISKP